MKANKDRGTSVGFTKIIEERSEYELLLILKNELIAADKLPFGEMVKQQKEILEYFSIRLKKPI